MVNNEVLCAPNNYKNFGQAVRPKGRIGLLVGRLSLMSATLSWITENGLR